jgi:hypothetical protein
MSPSRWWPWPALWIAMAAAHALGGTPHPQIAPAQHPAPVVAPAPAPVPVPEDDPFDRATAHVRVR